MPKIFRSKHNNKQGSKNNPIVIDIVDYCCICEEQEADFPGPNCKHTPKCCADCIAKWFAKSFHCPYCRAHLIPQIDIVASNTRFVLGIKVPANCPLPDNINTIQSVASKKRQIKLAVKEFWWRVKEEAEIEYNKFDNQIEN